MLQKRPLNTISFPFSHLLCITVLPGCQTIKIHVMRKHLLRDTYKHLRHMSSENLLKKFKIVYAGEADIDSGGLSKDFFFEIGRSFCFNANLCLFRPKKNCEGETYYDIDSRSSVNSKHLEYFHVFGKILGKAVYDRNLIDVNFSNLFLKRLLLGTPSNTNSDRSTEQVRNILPSYEVCLLV